MKRINWALAAALLAGNLAYAFALSTSFNLLQLIRSGYTPGVILLLTIIGGLWSLALGYASILLIGGRCSLGVANFLASITRSKHVIEYDNSSPKSALQRLVERTYLAYAAGLVFLLLVAIAWDLHNADGPHAGIFYPVLNATNIFLTRTDSVNPVRFAITSLPLLFFFTALAGLTPSLALPYLRNFKITSVNSGPFHIQLLIMVVGLFAGLGVILTLVGLIYRALWAGAGKALPSYHFVLLVMLGFSIHFAAGSYLGREKTERILVESLGKRSARSRVFFGRVDVRPRLEHSPQPQVELRVAPDQTEPQTAPEKRAR